MRRFLLLCLLLQTLLLAQPLPQSSLPMDAGYSRLVREWTTKPEFLPPPVAELPVSNTVPTPEAFLGSHIGAPNRLHTTKEIRGYFDALAQASPRIRLVEVGASDEGRPLWSAIIAEPEILDNIETYRRNLHRLADPRGLDSTTVPELIARSKPIYHVTGGLHSSETGPPEMLMELAYRLVVTDNDAYRAIRSNVIVMVSPILEPDGLDRYVEWYHLHKIHETSEDHRLPGPPYWGKYIYHDNNRDLHYSQLVMRQWLQAYLHWKPLVVHDLHESVPFLYTFSGQPPHNPNLDPIVYGELPWFANYELAALTSHGMPGVWTHAFVDMWSVAYLGFMASNHNGLIRIYETYGNGGANTMKRKVDRGDGDRFSAAKREWYRPLPAYKEVEWSLRNNINYSETAMLTALELAAAHPRTLLENFYRKSRNAITAGEDQPPYAYLIPAGQRDETRVAWVVNTLRLQGIEVGRLPEALKLEGGEFPAGSYLVKRNQPYGRLAKSLLEKQVYPEGALRTYDDTGWTMGIAAHVTVQEVKDKAVLEASVDLVDAVTVRGTVLGDGPILAVVHNGAHNLVTFRWMMAAADVQATRQAFTPEASAESETLPAGTLVLVNSADARNAIFDLGLRAVALPSKPSVPLDPLPLPRIAVYSTWGSTQHVGWVRHALDHYRVPYDLMYKERARTGSLRADYDLILIPSQGGSAKGIVFDIPPADRPLSYRAAPGSALGVYGESEDIAGGMGLEGALAFQQFVREGGTLITLGAASYFPPEFGIAREVSTSRPTGSFYAPGPIIELDPKQKQHSLFYGYPDGKIAIRYANGPLLAVPDRHKEAWTVANYSGTALSGFLQGGKAIEGKAAILDIPVGDGRVLLFGTNPCYHWQNHGEFPMLFNALMHYQRR